MNVNLFTIPTIFRKYQFHSEKYQFPNFIDKPINNRIQKVTNKTRAGANKHL